jgi:hypothetical protein
MAMLQLYVESVLKADLKTEISIGKKAHLDEWDLENKKAKGKDKETKEINLKISELTVDLNRYFYIITSSVRKNYTINA